MRHNLEDPLLFGLLIILLACLAPVHILNPICYNSEPNILQAINI